MKLRSLSDGSQENMPKNAAVEELLRGGERDESDTSKIPRGEPYVGKRHIAPLLCYGVTGRFEDG